MKNIKRFLLISVISLLTFNQANACSGEFFSTYRYFMMCFASSTYDNSEAINKFWKEYTKGKYEDYSSNADEIMDYAKKIKDSEMVEYLNCLNVYLNYASLYDYWSYPTKEDLENAKIIIPKMITKAQNYKGERLKGQYALLYVRFSFMKENYNDVISFWDNSAKNLPQSVYKTMIENYYAGALHNIGEDDKALEIFARNGDYTSIKWMVRNNRTLSGIKKIYKNNPNSKALYYLVQDYVNRIQDSFDEECDCVDYNRTSKQKAQEFLSFAQTVIKENKVKDLCLWNSACAMVEYVFNNNKKAKEYINIAMNCKADEIVKDNARCIKFLIYSSDKTLDYEYLSKEMQWLDSKIESSKQHQWYFVNVKERITMLNLIPYYRNQNNENMVLSLLTTNDFMFYHRYRDNYPSNEYELNLYGELNIELQNISAEKVIEFINFSKEKSSNSFEAYVKKNVILSQDYFNDLIGTKFIGQNEFKKAIPYLEKVSMSFINKQNIAYYMQRRDYTKERWLVNQYLSEDWEDMVKPQTMKNNKKIQFCLDMIDLLQKYNDENDTEKKYQLAYSLATLYYQASYVGQCWYLTDYSWSTGTEHAKDWQVDFYKQAEKYLNIAKNSKNQSLKTKSLYALAYIPRDSWAEYKYDWENGGYIFQKANRHSQKYKRLNNLFAYLQQNPKSQTDYTRKCDVLKQFAKYK